MTIAVTFLPRTGPAPLPPVAFIGGGNMASAIIGGLIQQGTPADAFEVVEPFDEARAKLAQSFGIVARPEASEALSRCGVMVWAVKPQTFADAAKAVRPFATQALHLSVAAGIPSGSIARWLGTERVVRGGSSQNYPSYTRCAVRGHREPDFRSFVIGFRCAKDL